MSVADIRQSYEKGVLLESGLAGSPFEQFSIWFEQALQSSVIEPTAMTLATATSDGKPSARIVLLKGYDSQGFVFFTNYLSRKGHELDQNSQASLLFFWPQLERQIRIEGHVEKIPAQDSDIYYRSRPLGSRVGAWASPQSQPITREDLELRTAKLITELGEDPPRPEHWGGYRLVPSYVEFWQGRPSRLHDRLTYQLQESGAWTIVRLAP